MPIAKRGSWARVSPWTRLKGQVPPFLGMVTDGMEGKRQQIECNQQGGQVLLAVPEAMFKVVAIVLQDVERLVLDLPAGAAAGGQFGNGVTGDRQVGDKSVAVCDLAGDVAYLDLEPVDLERVATVPQRHI